MEYKVNKDLTIEIKDFKPYSVTKAVKIAMMSGMKVSANSNPEDIEIPVENSIKAEEALILGMTTITQDQLDNLRDEEYTAILQKINDIAKVPLNDSWDK